MTILSRNLGSHVPRGPASTSSAGDAAYRDRPRGAGGGRSRRLAAIAIAIGAVLSCLWVASTAVAADSVYWTNLTGNTVSFANLDGSGGADLWTGAATVRFPAGVALDPAAGRIYWANAEANKISFAKLDGSGGGDLATPGATVSAPAGVAVDPAAGEIYWANGYANKISFARLDGTVGGDLPTNGATVNGPQGVALDPAAGRIYWANLYANKISFANLDGSGGGDVATGGATVNAPLGVAVAAGVIYWANAGADKISFADLDGSGGADLATGAATVNEPAGVALDPAAGRIYWGNRGADKIAFANLNGTGGGDLATTGATMSEPTFPALLERPSPRGAPAIAGGTSVGSVLACLSGSWAPDAVSEFLYRAPRSFGYQWSLGGTDIAGATQSSITANSPGDYRCRMTATNNAGSTSQTSAAHAVLATIAVSVSGTGSGTVTGPGIDCPGDCAESYAVGTPVNLTARPAAGSSFAGWGGACSGAGACQVATNDDHDVTATFTANPPPPSGTGGQLPPGPTGHQGNTGPQGQTGPTALTGPTAPAAPTAPTGPQGPLGKVVCKTTAAASLVCSLLLAPGTWTTAGAPTIATFAIDRPGRRIVTRHVHLRHRRMTVRLGHRLRPGRYVVTITVTTGHRHATLLRQGITIRRPR